MDIALSVLFQLNEISRLDFKTRLNKIKKRLTSTKYIIFTLKFSCTVMFEFCNSLFDMKPATEDVVRGQESSKCLRESALIFKMKIKLGITKSKDNKLFDLNWHYREKVWPIKFEFMNAKRIIVKKFLNFPRIFLNDCLSW